jgi:hypothetical protein
MFSMDSPIYVYAIYVYEGQYREMRAGEIGVVLPDFRYLVSPYARPLVLETRASLSAPPRFRSAATAERNLKGWP